MATTTNSANLDNCLTSPYLSNLGTSASDLLFRSFFKEMYLTGLNQAIFLSPLIITIRLRTHGQSSAQSMGFIQMQSGDTVYWQVTFQTPANGFPPSFLCVDSKRGNYVAQGYLLVDWSLFNNPANVSTSNGYDQINLSGLELNFNAITDPNCSPVIMNLRKSMAFASTSFTEEYSQIITKHRTLTPTSFTSNVQNNSATISINSQDNLNELSGDCIIEALNSSNTVVVNFTPGIYQYMHNQISLSLRSFTGKSLHFIGNGSTLIGSSLILNGSTTIANGYYTYTLPSTNVQLQMYQYICGSLIVCEDGTLVDFYGKVTEAPGLTEVYNGSCWIIYNRNITSNSTCRIARHAMSSNSLGTCPTDNTCYQNTYIQIYAWYKSYIGQVVDINDDYIYFRCLDDDMIADVTQRGITVHAFNANYCFGKMPFYRLINEPDKGLAFIYNSTIYTKINSPKTYFCNNGTFFCGYNLTFDEITFSGFNFLGNASLPGGIEDRHSPIDDKNCSIISFSATTANSICISNCSFSNLKGDSLHAYNSDNVSFLDNSCYRTYRKTIDIRYGINHRISNNKIIKSALSHCNDGAIVCASMDYYIGHNQITDYAYMGIGVGLHRSFTDASTHTDSENGIVEYNILNLTPEFRSDIGNAPLMDGGAIYTWTKNLDALIRYNIINGTNGLDANRGIFCDDGTYNVALLGNLVINCNNIYNIDLRTYNIDSINITNTNNVLLYNIIDGYYRFEGKEVAGGGYDNTNLKGRNFLLRSHIYPGNNDNNTIARIPNNKLEKDMLITGCESRELTAAVPRDMYDEIQKLPLPQFILSRIVKLH